MVDLGSTRNPELQKLYNELGRTAVLSENFKILIIQWTHKSIEWALNDQEKEREEQKKVIEAQESVGGATRTRGYGVQPNNPIF